ncbi:MAG: rane-bound O-acyltransferase family protein [Flavipsychrobacter sp.]|jgi:D-alanyl-lipoteichoic acid acyltransferase DltB (MBOAT superfamily)|nr:rane-bound O-acyltransferase family protein [Flavipsychrobacter sp.]
MLFNSFEFLLFFPVVTFIYFLLPHKYRWFHLLAASCYFYMAFIPVYVLILFFTIIIDYFAGILIENAGGRKRKWWLIMSLIANIGVLAYFKYYNFFIDNINAAFGLKESEALPFLSIILPIGLSFHTFQAMSYTIEVYRGTQKAERHLGIYALYVMFYPQLVAGPIERPQNVLHQFYEKHKFEYANAVKGLRLILWGLIKKVVIADRLASYVNPVFNDPHDQSAVMLGIAAVFFAFQIFCDFSGYSDIALGTARVMGFKLMTNFNKPYHARSISEFWKRWHISLSTWFRDYLYISLGGNRVSLPRIYFNLFFVFLVSGFWHGANWTFIVWGALHGFYLVFGMLTKDARNLFANKIGITRIKWLNNTLNTVSTFTLVTIAWIFFRANNVADGLFIVKKLALIPSEVAKVIATKKLAFLNLPRLDYLAYSVLLIIFLEVAHVLNVRYDLDNTFENKPAYVRWGLYYAGLAAFFFFGVFEQYQFIYFQF